jgi:hypothetical protein
MKIVNDPTEQTTAATDILLALAAGAGLFFLYRLYRSAPPDGSPWKIAVWSAAIGMIGLSAALGAAAHGLAWSPTVHRRIWRMLNMALALTVSLFVAGVAYDLWGLRVSASILPIVLAAGLGFYLVTLRHPGIFLFFIIYEALALSFALGAYSLLAIQGTLPGAGLMATGILISITAAIIQANKTVLVTLIWKFDHNGIYHLVQILGLAVLLLGLQRSLAG